jgi:CAAX prenyl protease-like protein
MRLPAERMPVLARVTPFAAYIAILALTPLLTGPANRLGIPALWLHPLNGVVAGLLLVCFWRYYDELRARPSLAPSGASVSVAAGVVIFWLWITLDAPWMVWGQTPQFDPTHAELGLAERISTGFRLLSLIAVVPLMEEIFWRSFLMRWVTDHNFSRVDPRRVTWFAFTATAVLFAVEHHLWLAGLVAGVAFNLLYMWTRNIRAPIIAHVVANACLGVYIIANGRWDLW